MNEKLPDSNQTFPSRANKSVANEFVGGLKRPYDHEMEQAVIGALMLDKDALTEVIEVLKVETFDKEAHQLIYKSIQALFGRSEPVDLLTVVHELRKGGDIEKVGGPAYISQLMNKVSSSANIIHHSRILVEYAIKRALINISNEISRDSYSDSEDVFEILDKAEARLFEVSEMNIRKNYSGMPEVMNEVIQELEAMKDHTDGLTGVPSGFTWLDRVTSGWQRSDLIIIAARPAMGKTAFVLSNLRNAAVKFNVPVAIFSLEMSAAQLVKRMISAEAELESEKLKTGKLSDEEWKKFIDKTPKLTEAPIFIDDTPALSVLELRAKCRRLKAQHDIQIIVIDYLQLMSGGSGTAKGNREQEIAFISRSLKQLAKELNVPVIALSQLSRAVETRGGDKRPQLSDLRESGSIEQDADMVCFLYRPEYYDITEDEEGNSVLGLGEVIIAKHRNGGLENVKLRFIGKYTRFEDWDGDAFGSGQDAGFSPFDSVAPQIPAANEPFPSSMNTMDAMGMPPEADFGNDAPPSGGETITLGSKMNNTDEDPGPPPF
ncbi:replicative DNA helicase [Sediminitomix flava]|uniref:Replicative DNA helicase n=1 Tax=Sediminitomix flava TaxID=379075 RepID=A0A315ZTQ3_SEDFL|nr:replicative DNA helicase [Sediminitomix flava]PWJ38614.1 primary replicative DNA helicase [Sediminitomix flava]